MTVYVFTAKIPEHGLQLIAVTDREPTIEEQWELLRKYLHVLTDELESDEEELEAGIAESILKDCCESGFEVDMLEVETLPLRDQHEKPS